ncbi:unnamed protein product [Amoebophrya sp. A120]|nr:unnamed protein product [Amoebophrya sp. A120]|eukprot:GSA120T00017889001.1
MAPTEEIDVEKILGPPTTGSASSSSGLPIAPRFNKEDLEQMNPAEIDRAYQNFLHDVDDVSQKVKDIVSGKITDFDAFDQQEAAKTAETEKQKEFEKKVRELRIAEQIRKSEEKLLYGRDGKGQADDYLLFCKFCFTEYLTDRLENCTRCKKGPLMTKEARHKELYAKLDDYKEEKAKHQVRKDKWVRWKKSQSLLGKSKVINYKAWEYWEPDSDGEDEENMEPVLPKDDPQFKALDADMKKRNKERQERHLQATRCKDEGNALLQKGDFVRAIDTYQQGLEYQKDLKPLWTNKALAEVKAYRYQDAVDSSSKLLELCEIFEDGFEKSKDLCFKAFSRRALGYRGLHEWQKAVEDLEEALKLDPKNAEAKALLKKSKEAAAEARYSAEVRNRLAEEKQKQQAFLAASLQEDVSEEKKDAPPANCASSSTRNSKSSSATTASETEAAKAPASGEGGNDFAMRRIAIEADSSDEEDEEINEEQKNETLLPKEEDENNGTGKVTELSSTAATNNGSSSSSSSSSARSIRSASATAISDLSQREYLKLMVQLEKEKEKRVLFCARASTEQKSQLDLLLAELETLSNRWKTQSADASATKEKYAPKQQNTGDTSSKRADEKASETTHTVASIKRIVGLLLPLCGESDFHCELCAPAARHLWPVISVAPYDILKLMDHMSHRAQSSQAMAEFVLRYPERLGPLFDVLRVDSKENLMPPHAEKILERPEQILENDMSFEMMLQPCARDYVLAILCNLQLHCKKFRTVLVSEKELIIESIVKKLDPMNWKSAALNLFCNLVANEMGKTDAVFTTLAVERCLDPLLNVLAEYAKNEGVTQLLPSGRLSDLKEQYLGALQNLVNVSAAARPLVAAKGKESLAHYLQHGTDEGRMRAANISQKVVLAEPTSVTEEFAEVLFRAVDKAFAFQDIVKNKDHGEVNLDDEEQMKYLEAYVKLGSSCVCKVPKFQLLFVREAPASPGAVDPRKTFLPNLVRLVCFLKPTEYCSPTETDKVKKMQTNCRGNLAVLFEKLVDFEKIGKKTFGLGGVVEPFIEYLRKESGPAQKNAGVCVTKLAGSETYRTLVRNFGGFESLQQIQLGLLQKEKEKPQPRPDWKPLTRS